MSHPGVDPMELGARLSDAVIMFHEALARSRGLSAVDHKALGIIERHGPMTAGDLAARIGLSPGAVTGLVDRLAARGHVSRDQDPADRRRIIIRATQKTPPAVMAAFTALGDSLADLGDRYTPGETAAIIDWVTRIISALEQQTRRLEASSSLQLRKVPAARGSHVSSARHCRTTCATLSLWLSARSVRCHCRLIWQRRWSRLPGTREPLSVPGWRRLRRTGSSLRPAGRRSPSGNARMAR